MKKIFALVIIALFIFVSVDVFASGPSDPPGEPTGGTPIGGGAPIGSGAAILVGLAAAYGARKWYLTNKEDLEE